MFAVCCARRSQNRDAKYPENARSRCHLALVQYIHAVLRRALEQARMAELVARNVIALVMPSWPLVRVALLRTQAKRSSSSTCSGCVGRTSISGSRDGG